MKIIYSSLVYDHSFHRISNKRTLKCFLQKEGDCWSIVLKKPLPWTLKRPQMCSRMSTQIFKIFGQLLKEEIPEADSILQDRYHFSLTPWHRTRRIETDLQSYKATVSWTHQNSTKI